MAGKSQTASEVIDMIKRTSPRPHGYLPFSPPKPAESLADWLLRNRDQGAPLPKNPDGSDNHAYWEYMAKRGLA